MNLKHGEGAYCKKEPHIHSGLIQWFESNRIHKCVCVNVYLCVRVYPKLCAHVGMHVKLCNESQLLTFTAVCGPQRPYFLHF